MKYFISTIFILFLLGFLVGCHHNIDIPKSTEIPESNCIDYETIIVDFEPAPFGNLVQTIPYHIQKEPIHDAFVSVKIATHQIPWVIYFSSNQVQFAPQATVMFDDYDGDFDRYVFADQSICEVHLWDTTQAHNYLYAYEQLIAELEIQCYNP